MSQQVADRVLPAPYFAAACMTGHPQSDFFFCAADLPDPHAIGNLHEALWELLFCCEVLPRCFLQEWPLRLPDL